jgi:hypothetical protein
MLHPVSRKLVPVMAMYALIPHEKKANEYNMHFRPFCLLVASLLVILPSVCHSLDR